MSFRDIIAIALLAGVVLGVLSIISVLFNYVRYHKSGVPRTNFLFGGINLAGLTVWQSYEVQASATGDLKIQAESLATSIVDLEKLAMQAQGSEKKMLKIVQTTCPPGSSAETIRLNRLIAERARELNALRQKFEESRASPTIHEIHARSHVL